MHIHLCTCYQNQQGYQRIQFGKPQQQIFLTKIDVLFFFNLLIIMFEGILAKAKLCQSSQIIESKSVPQVGQKSRYSSSRGFRPGCLSKRSKSKSKTPSKFIKPIREEQHQEEQIEPSILLIQKSSLAQRRKHQKNSASQLVLPRKEKVIQNQPLQIQKSKQISLFKVFQRPSIKEKEKIEKQSKTESQIVKDNNPLFMLLGAKQQNPQKEKRNIEEKSLGSPLKKRQAKNIMKKWLTSENKDFDNLKQKFSNQKNIRLKDYLKISSLSRQKKIEKSLEKYSSERKNKEQLSKRFSMREKQPIQLVQQTLRKKLQQIKKRSWVLTQNLQNEKVISVEYDDLVVLCNVHRTLQENVFHSFKVLKQMFMEFRRKKELGKIENQSEFVEQVLKTIFTMNSPKKKKLSNSATDFTSEFLKSFIPQKK